MENLHNRLEITDGGFRMTVHYEITKALHRQEFTAIHPCMNYRECDMVKRTTGKSYILYPSQAIHDNWSKFSHGVCPDCAKSLLEQTVNTEVK